MKHMPTSSANMIKKTIFIGILLAFLSMGASAQSWRATSQLGPCYRDSACDERIHKNKFNKRDSERMERRSNISKNSERNQVDRDDNFYYYGGYPYYRRPHHHSRPSYHHRSRGGHWQDPTKPKPRTDYRRLGG